MYIQGLGHFSPLPPPPPLPPTPPPPSPRQELSMGLLCLLRFVSSIELFRRAAIGGVIQGSQNSLRGHGKCKAQLGRVHAVSL
jgi:hypothetical protein